MNLHNTPEVRRWGHSSLRQNIAVIADEVHRSHYGFPPKFNKDTGEIRYGMAKYLRDCLPDGSFIGLTGTPIELDDKSTPAAFGDYIDKHDILRAVEDGATVPIYDQSRLGKLEVSEEENPKIDPEFGEIGEGEEEEESKSSKPDGPLLRRGPARKSGLGLWPKT